MHIPTKLQFYSNLSDNIIYQINIAGKGCAMFLVEQKLIRETYAGTISSLK